MQNCFIANAKLTVRWQTRMVDGKPRRYGPYHYLQRWVNGTNVTVYVPHEKVELARSLILMGEQFEKKISGQREAACKRALSALGLE